MPGNLTNGPDSATQDFATSAWRVRQLGFNSVRLPFRFRDLTKGEEPEGGGGGGYPPYPYTRLCGAPSPEMLKTTVAPPTFASWLPRSRSRAGAPLRLTPYDPPEVPVPAGQTKGLCNAPLSRTRTVRDRFHYVVAELVASGFSVMIDYHPGVRIPGSETTLDDLPLWVDEWERTLSRLLEAVPSVRGLLMVDLINEPDAFKMTWDGGAPLGDYYLAAIDRLHPLCPECLFLVEGSGQASIPGVHWGNGFVTDGGVLAKIAPYTGGAPPGNPTAFLEAALERPWISQLVISPHIYCPAVSNAIDCYSGPCFHDSLRTSYGHLTTAPGFCSRAGKCRVLAAIIGELGSTLAPGPETECMQTVVDWMSGTGGARRGAVAANASWCVCFFRVGSGSRTTGVACRRRDAPRTFFSLSPFGLRSFSLSLALTLTRTHTHTHTHTLLSPHAHFTHNAHNAHRFYWAWNPDSGDVGGLLNPTDW